ncbi:hypothetical protein DD237_000720 [Peronospora effusa]|uniref:HTH luxR-type domain-containing protein n=1 Tax=Peronospora effusa TaxID=542832 RepID=A0A425CL27_9STRA|nr:hypothetical protein DD237_000720 [Peronospora effusa]
MVRHDELPLVRQALDTGASGYITKGATPAVMTESVQRILDGHTYIEQALATELAYHPGDHRLQGMTARELEIFLMLAKGTPTRSIADQLSISSKTVSNHLTLLKSKLQVTSHAELVHVGIDMGLVRAAG